MNKAEIIDLQKRLRVEPDGFWGPRSIAASQRHLRALMPAAGWPKTDQASLNKFYGAAGDELAIVFDHLEYSNKNAGFRQRYRQSVRTIAGLSLGGCFLFKARLTLCQTSPRLGVV